MVEVKVDTPQAPILFTVDGYRLAVMPVFVGIGKKDGEGKAEAVAEAVVEEAEEAEPVAEAEAEPVAEDKPKRSRKAKEPVAVEA